MACDFYLQSIGICTYIGKSVTFKMLAIYGPYARLLVSKFEKKRRLLITVSGLIT